MRRLYSTFAQGLPGLGLLLVRLAIGVAACSHGLGMWRANLAALVVLVALVHVGLGALVIVGLWTPVASTLLALIAAVHACMDPALRWYWAFGSTVALASALIGPGRWSIDARLFGWRRIEIPSRRPSEPPD